MYLSNLSAVQNFIRVIKLHIKVISLKKKLNSVPKMRERVRMAQRQNDTVVKSTRCVTLARGVTLAQRQNDTVCHFGTATK